MVQKVFTNKLEAGDRSKAMKRLRVPPFDRPVSPWVIFRVGFWCGIFLALFSTAVIAGMYAAHFIEQVSLDFVTQLHAARLLQRRGAGTTTDPTGWSHCACFAAFSPSSSSSLASVSTCGAGGTTESTMSSFLNSIRETTSPFNSSWR